MNYLEIIAGPWVRLARIRTWITVRCWLVTGADQSSQTHTEARWNVKKVVEKIQKTAAEWQRELDPETYRVCRQKGTERAFTGRYWDNTETGIYKCAACGEVLFTSETKFDAGCGWPSFYAPAQEENVAEVMDTSHGMVRTEVVCSRCDSHLGHVFPDGPRETTGLRYCINSVSLAFESQAQDEQAIESKS